MIKSFIFALLICIRILPPDAVRAEDNEEGMSAFEKYEKKFAEEKIKEKVVETYRFKGFTLYRPQFAQICGLIDDDGHLEWVIAQGEKFSSLTECTPCRTLYLLIKSTCKIKKPSTNVKKLKKKEAGENAEEGNAEEAPEAQPTKEPEKKKIIRLDPSTELIDLVSIVFRIMAEKTPEHEAKASYEGVAHLIAEMRNPQGKTDAERSYFDTLAEYIEAPFKGKGLAKKVKNSVKTNDKLPISTPSTSIDELF